MKSICQTQCRNLTIGNRYGGLPKRFTRKSPRIISLRGFFHIVKVIEVKGKLKKPEKSCYMNSSEVFLVSIFLIKIDLDLNEGFGFT